MTTVTAYGAPAAKAPLERITIERRALRETDVLIDIKFSGICHTDVHQVNDDWGGAIFPMVPGHEIAGIVSEIGPGVTRYAVGDRVGVGTFVDSCGKCEYCAEGLQQYCAAVVYTYSAIAADGELMHGGFAEKIVVDQDYVVRIPEGLSLDQAAPLVCAGITMYSPLKQWNAGPGKKVAIVGLGGLGHLGVKLAKALGAEVTVLSQSLGKREDGLRLGADHYYATSDPKTFEELAGTFDLIILTVSASVDYNAYLSLLRVKGAVVAVGIPDGPIPIDAFVLNRGKALVGSAAGGIPQTQEMLNFCAERGIGAEIEAVRPAEINDAYRRLAAGDVRYRFVIDTATI